MLKFSEIELVVFDRSSQEYAFQDNEDGYSSFARVDKQVRSSSKAYFDKIERSVSEEHY